MIPFKDYINELSYPSNIGIMELVKFYQSADQKKASHVKQLIKDQKHQEAWEIIQNHTGTKLHSSAFGNKE